MDHDLRIGFRSLLRSPGFFATAVLSLALAIGASAAAFSVIDAVRFRALPFANANRLVVLGEVTSSGPRAPSTPCAGNCTVSYNTYATLLRNRNFRSIDAVVAVTGGGKALTRNGDAITLNGGVVSWNVFNTLGVQPLLGRTLTAADDQLGVPLVTVLSYALWENQFAKDPAVIGTTIKLSDSQYTVVGVMPPNFDFESGSQFWLPAVPTLDPSTKPSITEITLIARLAPGFSIEQMRAELSTIDIAIAAKPGAQANAKASLVADALRVRYASSTQSHDLAFGAIVACILLIACANLANLVLVRAMHQQREFGIRAALGADKRRLLQPVFVQNGMIVVIATVLGIALASMALGVLRSLPVLSSLKPTGMEYRMDWHVLVFAFAIATVSALIISLVPAKLASRGDLQALLRSGSRGTRGFGGWAHQAFVVSQIACATVLLSGAALMMRTVVNASRVDLGFDHRSIVTASPSFPHSWRQPKTYMPVVDQILAALKANTGVSFAAARAATPLAARSGTTRLVPDGHSEPLPTSEVPSATLSISPGYFATLGVKVLTGRDFSDQDRDSTAAVAVVNQWAARHWWPGQNAVGHSVRIEQANAPAQIVTIIGVVADNKAARPNLLLALDGAELYRPYAQVPSAFPAFFVRAKSRPEALLKPVREMLAQLVPDRPVQSALLKQRVDQQFSGVRANTMQIGAFAAVGLLLALIGVYGVLSFEVNRRTREIGIRSALGASRLRSAQTVLTNAVVLSGIGAVAGVPLALTATRLISSLLFRTDAADPSVYAAVVACILLVSLVAALAPALRATRVDPMVALRAE